jgi:predicted lipoprotein with Yx(FWY)xxD motif
MSYAPRILTALLFVLLLSLPALADHHKAKIMTKENVGSYIADAKGKTLYYFTKDSEGKSACSGECLQKWPPYTADKVEPQAGLNEKDFGVLKREEGTAQATYKGYPLYYFFKDQNPGDTNGQGLNNVWYVVDPANFPPKK